MKKLLTLVAVAAIGLSATPAFAGARVNGTTLNGLSLNGARVNGWTLNGWTLNGVSLHGQAQPKRADQSAVAPVVTSIRLGSGAVVSVR